MKGYTVVAIFPAVVINEGEVVSLQAELEVFPEEPTERQAIKEFRANGPLQAVGNGPWVHPKNAAAYIVKENE